MSWLKTLLSQYNKENLLFHGTGESIEGPLGAKSHGGILWVAETPDIAQSYIPESGLSTMLYLPQERANDPFPPNQGVYYDILKQMGYNLEAEWDTTGRVKSWGWKDRASHSLPKYRDVINYIENVLGYKGENGMYRIKQDRSHKFAPAHYKLPGTLFILIGKSRLRLFDLTGGSDEDDLMDPTYNKIILFRKAQEAGYDGVRINDFAQSKIWGNIGHRSIGIFPSGLAKLQIENTQATNFDWPENSLSTKDTDEFNKWQQQKNQG